MTSNLDLLYAAARNDFATFGQLAFEALNGPNSLEMNWHFEVMCLDLEKTATGETKRLVINCPPRNLKSFTASVAYPLWLLGRNPSMQIMCVSYSDRLVEDFGRLRLAIAQSPMFSRVFPKLMLRKREQSNTSLATTLNGNVFGVSLGGSITGRGCDVLILDDPMKVDAASSDTIQEATLRAFQGTLVTRLNHPKTGVIVLVMQRLNDRDLTALVKPLFDWKIRVIPAIATKTEVYELKSGQRFVRKKGTVIQPSRMDLAAARAQRRASGARFFESQYQQNPPPEGDGIIKLDDFQRYAVRPDLSTLDAVVLSVDPASSINPKADYSVITVWGILGDKFYLLHLHRKQIAKPQLQRDILALRKRWNADFVLIEKDGIGTAIFQDLRNMKMYDVLSVRPKGAKRMRLSFCQGMIEEGDVLLPQEAPWLANLALELLSFPNGEHDDQIDSITQFLRYAQGLTLPPTRRAPSIPPEAPVVPEAYESPARARAYARARGEDSRDRFAARYFEGRDALMESALRRIR